MGTQQNSIRIRTMNTRQKLIRVRTIEFEISELQEESRKLRLEIGDELPITGGTAQPNRTTVSLAKQGVAIIERQRDEKADRIRNPEKRKGELIEVSIAFLKSVELS